MPQKTKRRRGSWIVKLGESLPEEAIAGLPTVQRSRMELERCLARVEAALAAERELSERRRVRLCRHVVTVDYGGNVWFCAECGRQSAIAREAIHASDCLCHKREQ
jgi:hypothetical protein